MTTKNEKWMLARGYRAVYQGARCTLDGHPAGIYDSEQGRFAEVRPDNRHIISVQFTWGAVALCMTHQSGRFKS